MAKYKRKYRIFEKIWAKLQQYFIYSESVPMLFQHFIRQADEYGGKRQPFFFLIDFEQQKPLICPLEQAAEQGIYFAIQGRHNIDWQTDLPVEPFYLHKSPMTLAQYQAGFELVQEELQKGNSYLLNLTYATEIQTNYDLKQLFQHSQAAYKLYVQDQFVCFSPECFVRIEQDKIYTYPMKGTIDAALDNAEALLLGSPKEEREHYTIVDLMRNDLATVAQHIEVSRFRYVEKIQTARGAILQTSSEIYGHLAADWQAQIGSTLAKLLPAGSISGAPKEKTVRIIRQAEGQARGYYSGVFGVFDGDGLQSAVAIRFIERRADKLYFRSGGGITRHSRLQEEYDELLQKVYVPLKT